MALVTPSFVFIHVPRTGGTSALSPGLGLGELAYLRQWQDKANVTFFHLELDNGAIRLPAVNELGCTVALKQSLDFCLATVNGNVSLFGVPHSLITQSLNVMMSGSSAGIRPWPIE